MNAGRMARNLVDGAARLVGLRRFRRNVAVPDWVVDLGFGRLDLGFGRLDFRLIGMGGYIA